METTPSYLQAQVPYTEDEIRDKIKNNPIFQQQQSHFHALDEEPIRDHYYQQIIKQIETHNIIVDYKTIYDTRDYDGYAWKQEENVITITYESETEDLNCNIQENQITSSGFISGTLYGTPSNVEISKGEHSISITFTVSEPWPIIVIGGDNIDIYSTFILIIMAFDTHLSGIGKRLLIHNAFRHHFNSIIYLSMSSIASRNVIDMFYWSSLLCIENKEWIPFFSIILCGQLIEQNNAESIKIAENILIKLAKNDLPSAFLYLGLVYMNNEVDGFQSDIQLAIRYFKVAGEVHKLEGAFKILGRIYLFGINVPKDLKKGYHYLSQAKMEKDEIISMLKEAEYSNQEIKTVIYGTDSSMGTVTKSILCLSVCALASTALFFAFRKRRQ